MLSIITAAGRISPTIVFYMIAINYKRPPWNVFTNATRKFATNTF